MQKQHRKDLRVEDQKTVRNQFVCVCALNKHHYSVHNKPCQPLISFNNFANIMLRFFFQPVLARTAAAEKSPNKTKTKQSIPQFVMLFDCE